MEVITIDSSDDDEDNALAIVSGEEANGKDGCRQKQPIVTPKFSQSSDDDGSNDGGRNSCGSDNSIISSDDSIWDEEGLPSIRRRAKSKYSNNNNDTSVEVVSDDEHHCIAASLQHLSISQQNNATSTTITQSNINNEEDHNSGSSFSSVSSNDSIWDKVGFVQKENDNDDTITNSCCGQLLNNDFAVQTKSLTTKTKTDQSNDKDGSESCSSVSSDDSILDKTTGFTTRKKKDRVESYYDYYRLKHDNNVGRSNAGVRGDSSFSVNEAEKKSSTGILDATKTRRDDDNMNNNATQHSAIDSSTTLPPEVPLPTNGTWRVVLLMDHREFGCANNYLQTVEKKINAHFGGKNFCEITTLPSADYLYVARLISNETSNDNDEEKILDERVLDMVIERKNVADACSCLIAESKQYRPLSFFEVSSSCDTNISTFLHHSQHFSFIHPL